MFLIFPQTADPYTTDKVKRLKYRVAIVTFALHLGYVWLMELGIKVMK